MTAALAAFGVALIAEIGDKSQLLVVAFASRYRPLPVIVGLIGAATVALGLSVVAGGALGAALPERLIGLLAAGVFAVFGIWALRGGEEEVEPPRLTQRNTALMVFSGILLAELGDKTMIATMALAARQNPLATWIGAAAGMVAAGMVALVVGQMLGRRLPLRALRLGSGLVFLLVAAILAWTSR